MLAGENRTKILSGWADGQMGEEAGKRGSGEAGKPMLVRAEW